MVLPLIFLIGIVLFACSDPVDVEENINIIPVEKDTLNKNGIKPLSPGNTWLYQVKIYDSTSTMIDSYIYADSVTGDTVINKTNWYSTSYYSGDWQTNTTDGLRIRRYISGEPLLEWLEVKYPGKTGFSWQADASRRTIADTDTIISVTAGNFSCYYYIDIEFKTDTGWEYSDIFYSPKTGMIKTQIYREKSGGIKYLYYSVELISFKKE